MAHAMKHTRSILICMIAFTLTMIGLDSATGAETAAKLAPCSGIDHRTNAPAAKADENTLEGQSWDAAHGIWSEFDFVALQDGVAAYHYKAWEQGTNGIGKPSETNVAYVKTLTTKTYHQRVPLASQVLNQMKRNGGKALIEIHYFPEGWNTTLLQGLVNRIRVLGIQDQVYFTGTKLALSTLKPMLGPLFKVVFRAKVGKPLDDAMLQKYGADIVQARGSDTRARVIYWRSHGYPVWGSGPSSSFAAMKSLGLRRVQTDGPRAWINFCNKKG